MVSIVNYVVSVFFNGTISILELSDVYLFVSLSMYISRECQCIQTLYCYAYESMIFNLLLHDGCTPFPST